MGYNLFILLLSVRYVRMLPILIDELFETLVYPWIITSKLNELIKQTIINIVWIRYNVHNEVFLIIIFGKRGDMQQYVNRAAIVESIIYIRGQVHFNLNIILLAVLSVTMFCISCLYQLFTSFAWCSLHTKPQQVVLIPIKRSK